MCGIAGIFAYNASGKQADETELLRVRDAMVARGPDGAGVWFSADRRIGLAHRRLALVDLTEAGSQPMPNADGTLQIVFNGEIYNYRTLRRKLEEKGFRFRSTCDTEVLLHLYADQGLEMFNHLRGMYALALWDAPRRRLVLARDPFGMKPLYYADDGRVLRVASQTKALLRGGTLTSGIDAAGQVGFLLLGYVPEPWTIYEKVKALPAGGCLTIEEGGRRDLKIFCDIRRELAALEAGFERDTAYQVERCVRPALTDSVANHLIADVPVGVFLSAGLDSTCIAALSTQAGVAEINSITLGFKEFVGGVNDETVQAKSVAAALGLNHHTRWVTEDDFAVEFEHLIEAMDQPSIDGVNSYFVSLAAHGLGFKAALSGLGGDELFGGYPSYRQIPRLVRIGQALPGKSIGVRLRHALAPLAAHLSSPKYASLLEYGGSVAAAYFLRRALFMPWELVTLLDPEVVRMGLSQFDPVEAMEQTVSGIENNHLKIAALEMTWYMRNQLLRDADWAGMAHSIEIRMPFVDLPLLRTVMPGIARHPEMKKADFLAPILEDHVGADLTARPRTGFSVPVRRWLGHAKGADRGLRGWASIIAGQFGFA